MKKYKISLFVVLVFISAGFRCGGGGSTSDPSRGFDVKSVVRFLDPRGGGFERPAMAQNVNGFITANTSSNTIGFRSQFSIPTMSGFATVRDAIVPARWYVNGFIFDLNCARIVANEKSLGIGGSITLPCETFTFPTVASPNLVNAISPPQAVNISGEGFSNEYGMPRVAIYDESGQLRATLSSSSGNVAKGIDVQLPSLVTYYSGRYILAVNNITGDGSWQVVGTAPIIIYGNDPPDFPDDPDPCISPARPCLF